MNSLLKIAPLAERIATSKRHKKTTEVNRVMGPLIMPRNAILTKRKIVADCVAGPKLRAFDNTIKAGRRIRHRDGRLDRVSIRRAEDRLRHINPDRVRYVGDLLDVMHEGRVSCIECNVQ